MYTRLTLWAEVKDETPAVDVLCAMVGHDDTDTERATTGLSHRLFTTERWAWMLRAGSYYHQTQGSRFVYDDIAKAWWLNVDVSLKNYDGEIGAFLDWLTPFLGHQSMEYLGFRQYEEDDEPTLLYFRDGAFVEVRAASA